MTKRDASVLEVAADAPQRTRQRTDDNEAVALTPTAIRITENAGLTTLLDPFLTPNILGFVAVPRDCWTRTSHATQFLRTVASVCQTLPSSAASPSLVERYGPSSQCFWREMLFKQFDFSVKRRKGILNVYDEIDLDIGGHPRTARHADLLDKYQREVQQGLHEPPPDADGGKFLWEDYAYWHNLHVYYRPSQYGFLSSIHGGKKAIAQFPAHVDAYGFFHDLAVLVDDLRIHSVTVDARSGTLIERGVYPVLLGRILSKITPLGSSLIKQCGIVPTFWDDLLMVSDPWPGLPTEHLDAIENDTYPLDIDPAELNGDDHDEDPPLYFGAWRGEQAEPVKDIVYELLCDWRHVRIVSIRGPQFYIGKRPDTHCWIGFLQPKY